MGATDSNRYKYEPVSKTLMFSFFEMKFTFIGTSVQEVGGVAIYCEI